MDTFGRTVDYLRISITDRCNERCLYCMPEGYKGWESKPDHLTAEEIIRVVRVAAGLGFRKFRLTGGAIRNAVAEGQNLARMRVGDTLVGRQDLLAGCRAQLTHRLSSLGDRVGAAETVPLPASSLTSRLPA